jgi:hypothetical protein
VTCSSNVMAPSLFHDEYGNARENQDMHLSYPEICCSKDMGSTPRKFQKRIHNGVLLYVEALGSESGSDGSFLLLLGVVSIQPRMALGDNDREMWDFHPSLLGTILMGRVALDNLWVCPAIAVNGGGHHGSVDGCQGDARRPEWQCQTTPVELEGGGIFVEFRRGGMFALPPPGCEGRLKPNPPSV